jgi:iron(III) transport system ATP-binding protein
MASPALLIRNLSKRFATAKQAALENVDLQVGAGEFVTLLGPSGCGKTTMLRCIAGLETPDSGEIAIGERLVYSSVRHINPPPEKRRIGMVFQSYAMWPHMTVFNNVAYPLRLKRLPRAALEKKTREALALVDLQDLGERYPAQLSGGQQQRVALARAAVAEPDILLFDEPLSSLDASLRERMRFEIRALQRRLQITAVYVTHDQGEAMTMSDRIAVMNAGRIVQLGVPAAIYEQPANRFVAGFIGTTNFVIGRVTQVNGVEVRAETPLGGLRAVHRGVNARPGEEVCISIRPEHIALDTSPAAGGTNVWEGRVEQVIYIGDRLDVRVKVAEYSLRVQTVPGKPVTAGDRCYLSAPSEKCVVITEP